MKRLSLLLTLCLLLAACGGMTTRHLPRNPWKDTAPQHIEMRHAAFNYEVHPEDGGTRLRVVGEAFPDVNRLPDWASWYGEIAVDIYLVDSEGRVVARERQLMPAHPLNRESGFPVAATFTPGTAGQQPLFIAFGYRLNLLDGKPGENTKSILVTEGALEQ